MFQDDLKFGEHIKKMDLYAHSKLCIIRNTFHDLARDTFSHIVVTSWTFVLPEEVVLADSYNQFKNKLDFFKHKAFKYEITFKYD